MEGICKRIRHTVKPFVGVVRSRHRACDDVGVAPRTQGEPGPKGCRRAQSFWGLGCPKMYHEHGDTPAGWSSEASGAAPHRGKALVLLCQIACGLRNPEGRAERLT